MDSKCKCKEISMSRKRRWASLAQIDLSGEPMHALKLRNIIILWAAFSLLIAVAEAQEKLPAVDIFGGFSYLRAEKTLFPGGITGTAASGWETAVGGNFNRWFGLTAGFSGHHSGGFPEANYNFFLFGPTFSYRRPRFTGYAHVLFGTSRLETKFAFSGGGVSSETDSGLATALGGGFDLNLGQRWAVRVVQADYLRTNFNVLSPHNFRVSSGLVFRFGVR